MNATRYDHPLRGLKTSTDSPPASTLYSTSLNNKNGLRGAQKAHQARFGGYATTLIWPTEEIRLERFPMRISSYTL